ncbi:MAG: hypothetical protein MMC33_004242 [Icmadophila ericetorum]|nr:hypothetical protein [Icmadophila ericetorum]
MSILQGLTALIGTLTQLLTNGGSVLGTLEAPLLPQFLTNNPLPNGFPWSTDTTSNTNPYTQSPITGVIRPYDFTISRGYLAPDGVNKSVLLVNGQFPAPTIEVNWGDTIQVTVRNEITGPEEGVSLHWHGILQKLTPWYDGVPSVQQCPIAPGSTFTYSFLADLYGTTWYHSHYSAQYAGGLIGPLIVHGPTNVPYDIDIGPVILSDHYWHDYYSIVQSIEEPGVVGIPRSDNNLINGKGNANCAAAAVTVPGASCVPNAGLSKFRFQTGKVHRLRLINAGAEGIQRFTIDGHNMTVIANDFVPIKPYQTDVVTLGIGQRTDVLVTGTDKSTAAIWMRSDVSGNCSAGSTTGGSHAFAAIYYQNANTSSIPTTTATAYDDSHCGNDDLSLTTPVFPITPPTTPAVSQTININFGLNTTGFFVWTMNGESFRANYDNPLLLLANLGNTSYPDDPQWNVYNFGKNTSIQIVLNNLIGAAHPIHLHGHNYWVLSEGQGPWDGTIQGNPSNPQRRDVQILQPGSASNPSHLVIEFEADNPGVWPLHCHIAWHVSAGLYVNVMERPDLITEKQIPSVLAQTCRDWAIFSGHNVVDQIDSGL